MTSRTMLAALLLAVAISPSPGQHLEFSTVLPDSLGSLYDPTDIIINPVSGNCWVASSGGLLVFDPVTRARVRRLEAYGTLVVCPDAGKGYAVAPEGLTVLDLGADTVLGRVELPADAEYLSAAWSRTTNRLYVAANYDDEWDHVVRVLDVATDEWVAEVPFEDWLTAPVWDPVLDRVLVGVDRYTGDSSCLAAIDCGPDTLVAFAPVLDAGFLTLALNPGGRKAYCTGVPVTGWPVTGVVDVDSYAVIGALAGARGLAVIYNPVVDRAYCASGDTVQIFDGRTDSLRAEVGLAGSVYIYDPMDYRPGLAASPRTGRVYAAFEWPVGVAVIDTFDVARTAAVLPESSRMRGGRVCASPLADVVVSALFRDTVLVVDGAADTLAGALEYWYISVRSLVHNPAGNKLYAADPTADLLLVLGSDLALLGRIPLADFDPDAALVVNPALNRLYLVDDYRLQVVDCNTDRLIATLAVPAVEEARLVLYPPLGRLYVFAANGTPPVYVYDCLRNEIVGSVEVNGEVPCAVYHPRSDRIYFACKTPPNFRVLDPRTDSITDTLRLGADVSRGKMLANTEQDVVYFANDRSGRLYTFDVRSGTATDSVPLAFAPDTLFWNRRHGRLYIVRESGSNNLQVLDCRTGELSEPRSVEYEKAGVMDERYDKLYFGGSGDYRTAVIDCRTDSVEYLPFAGLYPRAMAWNPIDSRVYAVRINRFSVYRQDAPGIAGESPRVLRRPDATVIRATLRLAGREPASLLDITGRKVMELLPGANDVRHLAPGVYFVRATGSGRTAPGVTKVVVQR